MTGADSMCLKTRHVCEISHNTSFQHMDIAVRVSSSCLLVVCAQSAARSLAETVADMTREFQVAVLFAKGRHTLLKWRAAQKMTSRKVRVFSVKNDAAG